MRTIHIYHATYNYLATPSGVSTLRSSVMHNLRLKNKPGQPQWHNELTEHNLIWQNRQVQPLDALSIDERLALVDELVPKPAMRERKRWQKTRSAYKYKLQKAATKERKYAKRYNNPAHIEAADILDMLWQVDPDCEIGPQWYRALERLTIRRKEQRLNAVSKFIRAHNQLINEKPTRNVTHLQEGVIKIPSDWQVTHEDITPQEWLEFVERFLTTYFPDYSIKLMLVHDDEREIEEQATAHIHYYLDGQHATFGHWDLIKSQIEAVNAFTRQKNQHAEHPEPLLRENVKLTRKEMAVYGERYQSMFYDFFNKELAHRKGLNAERKPKEETQTPEYKEMLRQANLPKAQRDYQFATRHATLTLARCMQLTEVILTSRDQQHKSNEAKYRKKLVEALEGITDSTTRRMVTEACELRLGGRNAHSELEKVR
ncbi:hypothetical protein I7107_002417 [Vibrio parahaemolyticus]|nr:hypothetical protein [Vibrio parahaemolyticus]